MTACRREEVSRIDYYRVDKAEVIRAIADSERVDPEVVRAAVDLCKEQLRAREVMSGVFSQLLVFFSDQLRTHQGARGSRDRIERIEKAHSLATQTIQLLWMSAPQVSPLDVASAAQRLGQSLSGSHDSRPVIDI
jgi:hypothetical protein